MSSVLLTAQRSGSSSGVRVRAVGVERLAATRVGMSQIQRVVRRDQPAADGNVRNVAAETPLLVLGYYSRLWDM